MLAVLERKLRENAMLTAYNACSYAARGAEYDGTFGVRLIGAHFFPKHSASS